ncbi:MAG: hypothetical protein QW569_01565 [Candidatus Bathyarchaeia archaeon]|nr:hypothetical protein [Candidatus Bathyarchaeota archaeon]
MTALKTINAWRILAAALLCLGLIMLHLSMKRGDVQMVKSIVERYVPIFH